MKKPDLKRKSSRKLTSKKLETTNVHTTEIHATTIRDALHIPCHTCGDTTKIPIARFYDGFEGMFSCNSCQEPLDHVMDALDD